jgi:hypothetical protein
LHWFNHTPLDWQSLFFSALWLFEYHFSLVNFCHTCGVDAIVSRSLHYHII